MKSPFWLIGLAAACFSPAPAWANDLASDMATASAQAAPDPDATVLSLAAALAQAESAHPALTVARKALEAALAGVQQAQTRPNPELSVSIEDTRRAQRVSTVSLSLPLDLGGQREARAALAGRGAERAEAAWQQARVEVRAQARAAFFALLLAQQRQTLAEQSLQAARQATQAVSRSVAAGKLPPLETTRAEVDLAQVQLEATEAASAWQTARGQLALALGEPEPRFGALAGDASDLPQAPPWPALVDALEQAPALRVAQAELAQARAQWVLEQRQARPDLTVSLGRQHDAASGRSITLIGLSMPLPVTDRRQAAVLESLRRAEQAEAQVQATRLQLRAELQEAVQGLTLARASLDTLQGVALPAAQLAYETAHKGLAAGRFGAQALIDAQRALLQVRARYLHTLAAAHQAAARIDRIAGR